MKSLPWKKGRPWVPEHGGPQQSWRCLPPMPDSNFSNLEVVESPLIFGFSRIFTRAAERTPRPHPVTSFVLSAVLLISFRLIQFSGTLAFYHKTIFMVRCFFAVVLTWCWLRDDWKQVRHKFWSKNYTHIWSKKYIPENEHSNMWIQFQKFQKTILVLNNDSFFLTYFCCFTAALVSQGFLTSMLFQP